jgi:hypothetical protein
MSAIVASAAPPRFPAAPPVAQPHPSRALPGDRAEASATVLVADRPEPSADLAAGVPEPELIDDAGARWRSRFDGQRWQVNASHEDYIALRGEPRSRLR